MHLVTHVLITFTVLCQFRLKITRVCHLWMLSKWHLLVEQWKEELANLQDIFYRLVSGLGSAGLNASVDPQLRIVPNFNWRPRKKGLLSEAEIWDPYNFPIYRKRAKPGASWLNKMFLMVADKSLKSYWWLIVVYFHADPRVFYKSGQLIQLWLILSFPAPFSNLNLFSPLS